jgi:hypothetical protein
MRHTPRMYICWVLGAILRMRMSSIMRCRNGETAWGLSSLMALLLLIDEAHRLSDQHTKQSLSA